MHRQCKCRIPVACINFFVHFALTHAAHQYALLGRGAFVNGTPLRVPAAVCVPLARAWVNMNHYSDVSDAFVAQAFCVQSFASFPLRSLVHLSRAIVIL